MKRTVVTLGIVLVGLGFGGAAQAQDLPSFCGPAGQLPAEFSGNVVADSRCFEIRMYTAEPEANGEGGIDDARDLGLGQGAVLPAQGTGRRRPLNGGWSRGFPAPALARLAHGY